MNNLDKSFASLVKNNNGYFKSEKQAEFLLEMCDNHFGENSFKGENFTMYGNQVFTVYYCDSKGVFKTEKHSFKKGISLSWERKIKGIISMEEKKTIARYKREIKKYKQKIAIREEAMSKGEFNSCMGLYIESSEYDKKQLKEYETLLVDLLENI